LAAAPNVRARVWVIHRLLNPKFDQPDAQMPNMNLTREKAEAIASDLLGESREQRWRAIVTGKHFLGGALAGALAVALLFLMAALFRRLFRRRAR
jgi:hypothetical protein